MTHHKNLFTFFKYHKLPLLLLCLCCIVAGAAWYFLYIKKTPEYSLNRIHDAIAQHDVDTFAKLVDLHTILSSGYDDLMYVLIETDPAMRPEAKSMVLSFSQLLKEPVVAAFKEGIIRYIQFGTWEDEKKTQNRLKNQMLPEIHPEKFADKTGMQNVAYQGIAYVKQNGNQAMIGIKVFESELNQEFILDLEMQQLEDGLWQVTQISNTRDYLAAIAQAKKQALKDYLTTTNAIVAKHQEEITQLQAQLSILTAENKQAAQELLQQQLLPAWQAYKEDLEKIAVPNAAKELSHLRAKIIELREDYTKKQIDQLTSPSPTLEINLKTLNQQATELNYRVRNIIQQTTAEN